MKKKRVLLLGGTRYVIPVIQTIHEMGHIAITCDNIPENIAHQYSDEYYNVSIVDKNAVLSLAKDINIHAIMSFATDPGVVTAAYVAEHLSLPSAGSYEAISILQDKVKFRKFLTDNGFNSPKSQGFTDFETALSCIEKFHFPIIVKPADSAGSKGVSRVNNLSQLKDAFDNAISFSLSKKVIIEDFLQKIGCSSDTDCFSVDGKLIIVTFSSQYFDKASVNEYVPSGYIWPASMTTQSMQNLEQELQRLITLLGLKTSIFNVETRECSDGKAYLMEVAPRGGGNRLAEMIRYGTGVDLIKASVLGALGEAPTLEHKNFDGVWAMSVLHSDRNGIFRELKICDELKKFVKETDIWVNAGDPVAAFSAANASIGTIVYRFETMEQATQFMNNINDYVEAVLENS